jgi:ankyrin repeat protein
MVGALRSRVRIVHENRENIMKLPVIPFTVAFALGIGGAVAQDASESFYQAIRNNDVGTLRTLLKNADANTKDKRGTTPLMMAAAYGSSDAMNILVTAGADVNAKNDFGATALHWCAGDLEKVRLLVDKGADVNTRSKMGRTPLLIAAAHGGGAPVVELLLAKGAKVSVVDNIFSSPLSVAAGANDAVTVRLLLEKGATVGPKDMLSSVALMNAAAEGNGEIVKMLLDKGANVNAASPPSLGDVKNGPIALGKLTPLLFAAAYSGPETIKLLLDAGADVNVRDVRGMTPVMLAVASDHPNPRVIRMLIEKGADPKIKSKNDESTLDWAKKFVNPPVLEALGVPEMRAAASPAFIPVANAKMPAAKQAVEKSIALLQRASASFFTEGGCVGCHAQNLSGVAIAAVRRNGFKVDEARVADETKSVKVQWSSLEQPLLQRGNPVDVPEIVGYSLLQLAAENAPPDRTTDAMIHNIASTQRQDGNWHVGFTARPPIEDGDFGRTAVCLRSLQFYGFGGRKAEFDQRVQRAAAWLESATPRTTDDRVMQLLGIKWATGKARPERIKALIALQRSDGGWAQTPELASDAYATGQVLSTLHELGVSASDAVYRRGVEYLLKTQLDDGSWHVASRAVKFQPYFQSGFPHDHDQWISASATAWATMALSYAAETAKVTAENR